MSYTRDQIEEQCNFIAETCTEAFLQEIIRLLLAESDALRENAKKNQVDADCFRWWVHEAAVNPCGVAVAIAHCITEQEYRDVICGALNAKDAAIDAARKGVA